MATLEYPPNFEMLHGCPTPPPTSSTIHAPRSPSQATSHSPPLHKRMGTPRPLHTPPLEFTPIGHNQFRFTRAQSIERSSRPSSISGHAYAGTTPQETNHGDSSDDESDVEDKRPMRRVEKADFELEEVDSDNSEDLNIEIVQPDHCEDAKSDHSGAGLDDTGVMERLRELHVEESSTDEEAKEERIYLNKKKKKWSAGGFKRTHSQSVEGDSGYLDDDPLDDNDIDARRLRRKLRGPGPWNRRASLIFEDRGFPNTNNIEEVEEPEEGVVKHTKGPPSIPSDDAFTLDELPFWRGAYDSMDVEDESE